VVEDSIVQLVNVWLTGNPAAQITLIIIAVAIVRWSPVAWSWKTGRTQKAKSREDQLHKDVTETVTHLRQINGSVKAHHADTTIHPTEDKCFKLHQSIVEAQNGKLDEVASGIYTRLDSLATDLSFTKGKLSGRP